MLLHSQPFGTSQVQVIKFRHWFTNLSRKKERDYNCHKMIPTRTCRICLPFSLQTFCTFYTQVEFETNWCKSAKTLLSVRARWHQQEGCTQCFSEVMVKLLLAALIPRSNAAFHAWMQDFHTSRFLQEISTQCFSEVMVKLLLAAKILMGNAAFHPWMKDFHTVRFLQEVATQFFSEVMAKPLLAAIVLMDKSAFHPWMKDFHTSRFLQEIETQSFSEVMVKLLLAAKILMGSAAFHPWMKDFHTVRFLQDVITQCFSEVMVKLFLAALIPRGNAAFHPWMQDFHTSRFLQGCTQCFLRSDWDFVGRMTTKSEGCDIRMRSRSLRRRRPTHGQPSKRDGDAGATAWHAFVFWC